MVVDYKLAEWLRTHTPELFADRREYVSGRDAPRIWERMRDIAFHCDECDYCKPLWEEIMRHFPGKDGYEGILHVKKT